jgi:hypothetical protein
MSGRLYFSLFALILVGGFGGFGYRKPEAVLRWNGRRELVPVSARWVRRWAVLEIFLAGLGGVGLLLQTMLRRY